MLWAAVSKVLLQVQVDNIHSFSPHLVVRLLGHKRRPHQAGPVSHNPVLAGLDLLAVLSVLRDGTQDDVPDPALRTG